MLRWLKEVLSEDDRVSVYGRAEAAGRARLALDREECPDPRILQRFREREERLRFLRGRKKEAV